MFAVRARTDAAPRGPLQRAARLVEPAGVDRPPSGVARQRAAAPARLPRASLQGQPAMGTPGGTVRRSLHAALRRVARSVRGGHALLLRRRVRQGCTEGPARGARRHRRMARALAPQGPCVAGAEEHRRAGRVAAVERRRARAAAVRHARALPARAARPAGGVQGRQRGRGLRGHRRGGRRQIQHWV